MQIDKNKIRLMLLEKNISKEELADRMKVSVNRIYQILSGTGKPHDETVKRLADALGCKIDEIIII